MPELPEVETVRRYLQSVILKPKAKKIKAVNIYYPKIIKDIEGKTFIEKLVGQTFTDIGRYGKHIFLKLNKNTIISHLRMTGCYCLNAKPKEIQKHDHIEFLMSDGSQLVYSDTRKFGTMHLVAKGAEMEHDSTKKLGPQATDPATFSPEYILKEGFRKSCSIKEFLLDQDTVCGIGNIYADEILYASGVHPERAVKKITKNQAEKISITSEEILNEAIKNKGTTFRSFHFGDDEKGKNVQNLKVYGRDGQECLNCKKSIQKIKLGGRGTHFCSNCQK